jgi:hypothetical protein
MKNLLLLILSIHTCLIVSAQKTGTINPNYPKGYFRYPLDVAPRLNANFGEMRPNHFHMGLDLFTLRKENLPIYAAADGYVARVKIEPGGFGNAIYINHPNGFTTLYAHMNELMPALQQYVKQQQYRTESWAQELEIPAGMFPLKKGDMIGYSGNTGGSQGPHVHFEIRETASEKCLNPLLFGFNIPDNVAPVIYKIGIYNRDQSIYEQIPVIATAMRSASGYKTTLQTLKYRKFMIAVHATDQMTGVPNSNGIYRAVLYEGQKPVAGFVLDRVGYDETRYLNAHIDYRTKMSGGSYIQFLLPLPGDQLQIYPYNQPGAYLELKDDLPHEYRLEIQDPNKNTSNLYFTLQTDGTVINTPKGSNLMRPGEINVFENDEVELFMPEHVLYDSIYFKYAVTPDGQVSDYSPVHHLHNANVPLHGYVTVRIKPNKTIPYNLRDRIVMKKQTRANIDVTKANWEMGRYVAKFRDFGSFQLIADLQPPQISGLQDKAVLSKAQKIVIYVKDDNNEINGFRAELDGKWLRFVQRGNTFTYVFDEKCPPGEHELKISVNDEAGNQTTKVITFTR